MFLFLFTLYSHHESNSSRKSSPQMVEAVPEHPQYPTFLLYTPLIQLTTSLSFLCGGVNVFSFTQPSTLHLTQLGNSSQFCAVLSLGFLFAFSLFPYSPILSVFLRFFFPPTKHTIIISILMLQ